MAFTRFYRRRFLNRRGHHAGAYVLADISVETRLSADERPYVDAFLTVSDCSRVTTLDFSSYDRAAMANALSKAHKLKAVLDDFVEALEAAGEEACLR